MMKYTVEFGDELKAVEASGFVAALMAVVGEGYQVIGRHQQPGQNTYLLEAADDVLVTAVVTQFLPVASRVYGLFIDGNLIDLVNDAASALDALGFETVASRTLEGGGQEYIIRTLDGTSFIEALPFTKNEDTPDD